MVIPNTNKSHYIRIEGYSQQIQAIFDKYNKEFAKLGLSVDYDKEKGLFYFKDYPEINKKAEQLLKKFSKEITTAIQKGCVTEWDKANANNDLLVQTLLGRAWQDAQYSKYFNNHNTAKAAFLKRKQNGMDLSQKIWQYASQYKENIEDCLSVGIEQGTSATKLSRQIRQYLNEPDKLFRRVRNEFGELRLSKNAKAYNPGTGVYRSSYKNAMRLTRTEINMAYRYADYERWKDMDFVLGVKIQLSGSHPKYDICDILQGEYPKDFKFAGWHPQCLCFATPILQSDEDFIAGKEPKPIKDLPQNFKDWYEFHKDEIQVAIEKGKLPYFLRDNFKFNDKGGFVFNDSIKSPLEIAKERHANRTQKQIDDIKKRWNERKKYVPQTIEDLKKKYGDELPKTLKELDIALEKFPFTDPDLKKNEFEINALMKKFFNDNDLGMDIKAEFLDSVFEKGFLNTFQVGRSGGLSFSSKTTGKIEAKHERLIISHRMFNPTSHNEISDLGWGDIRYYGKQFNRDEYEKYGHLLDKDKYQSYKYNLAEQYGNVQVRFKKDKVLCTWTFNDSLCGTIGDFFQPSLTTDPKIQSFDIMVPFKPNKHNSWDSVHKWQKECGTDYIELQFHGKVTIDDVQSFTFADLPDKFISKELIKKLQEKGIELWYIKDDKAVKY